MKVPAIMLALALCVSGKVLNRSGDRNIPALDLWPAPANLPRSMCSFATICVAVLVTGLSANALRIAQPYTIPPERGSTVKDQSWFMGLSGVALWSTMLCLAALDFDLALS